MKFIKRIIIDLDIQTATPLHIGGSADDFATDMPIALDGSGTPYIPATSIAGVFRDYISNYYAAGEVSEFFGTQGKKESIKSFISIDDAVLINGKGIELELRDHNSINRETHTTQEKSKFDEMVLPAGYDFHFIMEAKIPNTDNEVLFKEITALIMSGLKRGHIFFGGHTSRGLGRMNILKKNIMEYDLKKGRSELERYWTDLANGFNNAQGIEDANGWIGSPEILRKFSYAMIELKCAIDGDMLIGSGMGVIEGDKKVDIIPLQSRNIDGKSVPVIPGSSIKGIMRTRADMIIRTLVDEGKLKSNTMEKLFGDGNKIKVNELEEHLSGNKFLNRLFGTSIDHTKKDYKKDLEGVSDEFMESPGKVYFEDAYLYNNGKAPSTEINTHVKIDRFTGGAVDGALYNIESVSEAFFDLKIMVKEPEKGHLGLMGHLLKDLVTGDLRIGFGTRKGLGKVKFVELKDIDINMSDFNMSKDDISDKAAPLKEKSVMEGLSAISTAFCEWIGV